MIVSSRRPVFPRRTATGASERATERGSTHLSNPIVSSCPDSAAASPLASTLSVAMLSFSLPLPLPFEGGTGLVGSAGPAAAAEGRALLNPRYLPFPQPASMPRLPGSRSSKKLVIPGQGYEAQFERHMRAWGE